MTNKQIVNGERVNVSFWNLINLDKHKNNIPISMICTNKCLWCDGSECSFVEESIPQYMYVKRRESSYNNELFIHVLDFTKASDDHIFLDNDQFWLSA